MNVGDGSSVTFTLSQASGTMSSSDTITAISFTCTPAWSITYPMGPPPAEVTRTCSGSGSGGSSVEALQANACFDSPWSFTVDFNPTSGGMSSCTFNIMGTDPKTVQVVANGVAPALAMTLTPPTVSIGDVRVGSFGSGTAVVTNTGTSTLNVTSTTVGGFQSNYTVTNGGGFSLTQNQTRTIGIRCSPPAVQSYDTTFTVTSNAGTRTIDVHCNGIDSDLVLTPSPIDLTTRVNQPVMTTVTLENQGSASATINSYSIVEANGAPIQVLNPPGAPFTLASGSSTSIMVRYSPTAPTAQQATAALGKLRVTHQGTQTRDATIIGAALTTVMDVFPDTVDFGAVCAGTTDSEDVTVKKGAAGSFTLSSVTPPAAPFTFTAKATNLPLLVDGDETATFTATIAPTATGMAESNAVLVSDIPGGTMKSITLKANVLPGGVGAAPNTLDFGGVMKNATSSALSTEVRNCSNAPLAITDVHMEGPNAGEFSVVLPSDPLVTLQPQESVKYHVVLNAMVRPGAKTATLVIASASSSTQVTLLATALGASDDDDTGSRSYYTGWCSTSGDAGYGALVLAVAFLLRRRRRN